MSEERFGSDVTFELSNPLPKILKLAGLIALVGVLPQFVFDDRGGRLAFYRWLGLALVAFATWMIWAARGYLFTKRLALVVTPTRVEFPQIAGRPRVTANLEDIRQVLLRSQGGKRQGLVLELESGRQLQLDAFTLPAELEADVARVITERVELRRAGVRSRRELAAAEAYLAATRRGVQPFGIRVASTKHDDGAYGPVALVLAPEDARETRDDFLYVPADAYELLVQSGKATTVMKPLRGV